MRHICKECGGTVFYQTVLVEMARLVDGNLEHLEYIDDSDMLVTGQSTTYFCNNCETMLDTDYTGDN